jgi:hypothetical protein
MKRILAEKVKQGVDVRILYDDVGSIGFIDSVFVKRVEALGIKCRVFNPLVPVLNMIMNNRDHRKMLIVDGQIAFTGGLNLANEYFNRGNKNRFEYWKDNAVQIQGQAVHTFLQLFLQNWNLFAKDIEDFTSNEILSKINGVNAILDGHTHKVYNETSKDKDNKDIYIAQTGTKLANIGQLIIKPDGTIHSEIITEVPEPNDKTGAKQITRGKADRWVDTEINEFIDQIYGEHSEELNIQIGHSDYDFIIRPEGSSDSHTIYCRYQECTLGNLVADSFREVVESNISYINGGSIRDSLLKGDISRRDILNVMPFFNSLFVKEITGQTFLDALEFGVSKLPNAFGGFPQVSGCTFSVNTSFNSTVETDSDGMFVKVGGERRVSNVKINGKPLNLTQKYNLSASEFLLSGGDGFTMFSEFPTVNESIFADSDALGHYIKYNLNGKIPSKYKELQDRINIDKEIDDEDIPKIKAIGVFLKRNKTFLALLFLILM